MTLRVLALIARIPCDPICTVMAHAAGVAACLKHHAWSIRCYVMHMLLQLILLHTSAHEITSAAETCQACLRVAVTTWVYAQNGTLQLLLQIKVNPIITMLKT